MKNVVIGFLGATLDVGSGNKRWEKWRPSVALCQHEELLVDRFELLYQERFSRLTDQVAADIRTVSPETEVCLRRFECADPWDFEQMYSCLYDFTRAYRFDPENEEYLIHITTGTHVAQICLFLLTESRHLPGKLLQTGPRNERKSSEGTFAVIDLDLSRYDRIAQRFTKDAVADLSFLKSGIATKNGQFNRLIEQIEQVALITGDPILLTGPTGAGKSQLSRNIFALKKSRALLKGRFIELNCATLRGDAAMSALFGHVRGAFTGAVSDRDGALLSAHEGMLFLDEIGELGPDEQAMLLRAIEDGVFQPFGSDREVKSSFQLICGTNRNLQGAVAGGTFREDLLERINLWTFALPGLAQRREDIAPNLEYELDAYSRKTGRRVHFNREARERFLTFATSGDAVWSGNFRDLSGAVTRMATLAPSGRITNDDVDREIGNLQMKWRGGNAKKTDASLIELIAGKGVDVKYDLFDRCQLEAVIAVCQNSATLAEAGRTLFAVSRSARTSSNDSDRLRKYLARFGLGWEDVRRK
jgi:transcriptional regulatory protein RtcR